MDKKIYTCLISVFVLMISVLTFMQTPFQFGEKFVDGISEPLITVQSTEEYFTENLAFRDILRDVNFAMKRTAGYVEMDGLFLVDDGLIKRNSAHNASSIVTANTEAIIDYANSTIAQTAVVLLPTTASIYQDKLPLYATDTLINERKQIEDIYKDFSGSAMAINAYTRLFDERDEYIYYNTSQELTMRGGYEVYCVIADRFGLSKEPENSFSIQYLNTPYYGELYSQLGYDYDAQDTVAVYHYMDKPLIYDVEHWIRYETKQYHSLYPINTVTGSNPKDAILGGVSPKITIKTFPLATTRSLLIFGDENALSFLPFLALNYSEITYVNPSLMTNGEIAQIVPDDYSQIIFAFSIESYTNDEMAPKIAREYV